MPGLQRADEASQIAELLDRMLDACAVYVPVREDGRIVDFHRVHLNPAGIRRTASMGVDVRIRSMREASPAVMREGLFSRYVDVVENQRAWLGEDVAYRGGAVSGVYDIQAWPVGEGFAVTWREVTDRERVMEALRESEHRFRATVDQLPDSVSVFESVRDDDGTIVDFRWNYCNGYTEEMTGFSREKLIGERLLDVFPEQGPAGMVDVYADVVESGESWQQPTVWYEDTWGDGERRRRAFDVRASKVGDGFVVVSRDVTELRLITAALEESNASLSNLIGLMGHDLRNPLTAASGFLGLCDAELGDLERDGAAVGPARELLARAQHAARRVEGLLADVLEMSRIDYASLRSRSEVLALATTVAGAVEDAALQIAVEPEGLDGLTALADESHLRQVLVNLLSNAEKYGAGPVRVTGSTADARTRLMVTDSGSGVPADFVPQLFDRFSRASTDGVPGTGLGLHLARELCRAMGGDLTYEPPTDEHGPQFVVELAAR